MKKSNNQAGFTLLEIMLVLVLLSLGAVAVVINLPSSQEDLAKEEAMRFFHRLQLLNEDAILNGKDFGIRFEAVSNRYKFLELTQDGWQLTDSDYFSERKIDSGLKLGFVLGSDAWNSNQSLFDNTTLFDEEMFAEFKDKKQQKPPQVFVLSSGEITPFEVSLFADNQKESESRWRVKALESGLIELLEPGDSGAEDSQ
ncbi:type II secretion system minor pseudopilin GspH [Vibrio hannami]|uniref:type II secretion system minor pseudopilin GspH n=1 Tax=Vibrio hannami TaxID=2717094 RepID=UPI00240FB9BB|nr:type II secretion system minor pseudopilin GspH [Vibrio hannami]MDG3086856.1 type II secretion system minor pseudopilin GspH [Vibrio hannami]